MKHFFKKAPIPDKLPKELEELVPRLKQSKTKKECLQTAYRLLSEKYQGYFGIYTYLNILETFVSDINKLCDGRKFLHCHNLNYLLRILLIKSGFFSEEDIKLGWSMVWYISPHQYLKIDVGEEVINVDLWGSAYGRAFGDYGHGFR